MHLLHEWSSSILLSLTTLPVWQDAWACRQTCSSWRFCWPSLPSNPTPGPHCLDSYPPPPSWPSSYQHPGCSSSHQMNYMNSFSNSPSLKLLIYNGSITRDFREGVFWLCVIFVHKLHELRPISSPVDLEEGWKGASDAWVQNQAGLLLGGDCQWPPSPTPLTLARVPKPTASELQKLIDALLFQSRSALSKSFTNSVNACTRRTNFLLILFKIPKKHRYSNGVWPGWPRWPDWPGPGLQMCCVLKATFETLNHCVKKVREKTQFTFS